jgi:glycosyltransferase involved in cell wall biosynthesis
MSAEGAGPGPSAELVSVVIAVRDGARYLGEAIESVLAQAYRPLEVVVVDDGSTDATREIAAAFGPPVRVVSQPPSGVGAALNRGAALARGSLLAFLDADDLWLPDKLIRQTQLMAERAELDAVFGHVEHFRGEDSRTITIASQPGYFKGTMLIRRSRFDAVGPFSAELRLGDFVEWYARAVDAGLSMRMLPQVALLRRVHDSNLSIQRRDERAEWAVVMKTILDRRRSTS